MSGAQKDTNVLAVLTDQAYSEKLSYMYLLLLQPIIPSIAQILSDVNIFLLQEAKDYFHIHLGNSDAYKMMEKAMLSTVMYHNRNEAFNWIRITKS